MPRDYTNLKILRTWVFKVEHEFTRNSQQKIPTSFAIFSQTAFNFQKLNTQTYDIKLIYWNAQNNNFASQSFS